MKKIILALWVILPVFLWGNGPAGKTHQIWEDKTVEIEGYSFQIISGTEGFLLQVSRDGEVRRTFFENHGRLSLTFPEYYITVAVKDFCELPPVHIIADVSFVLRERVPGPHIKEGEFLGQKAIFLENEYIYLTILPELGGRIIEMGLQTDRENFLYVDRQKVSAYRQTDGWQDIGGWEDNQGRWSGPFWNRVYSYKITERSPDKVSVVFFLEHGPFLLEKTISVKKGQSSFEFILSTKNKSTSKQGSGLGIHPEFTIGGSADLHDYFFWGKEGEVERVMPYTCPNQTFSAGTFEGMAGIGDAKTLHMIVLSFSQPLSVNFFGGDNYYNLELSLGGQVLKPEEDVSLSFNCSLYSGMAYPDFFQSGITGRIKADKTKVRENEDVKLSCTLVSSVPFSGKVILKRGGEVLQENRFRLEPLKKQEYGFLWNSGNLPDGVQSFSLEIKDKDDKIVLAKSVDISIIGAGYRVMSAEFRKWEEELNRISANEAIVEAFFYLEKARAALSEGNEEEFYRALKESRERIR